MSPGLIPLIIVPTTFLFVLLIVLIAKAPKVGACLVGGLVFLVPILLWRAAMTGALNQPTALPIIIVPGTFLFVLLVVLIAKAPRAGVALTVLLVVMGLFGVVFGVRVARQSTVIVSTSQVRQQTQFGAGSAVVHQEFERVSADYVSPPSRGPRPPAPPSAPAPIWSAGIEQEMKADVYPSKPAAARAAGEPLGKAIRELTGDVNTPTHVVIFQEAHEYRLIAELRDGVRRALPEVSCDVEAQSRPLNANEVVVTLYLGELDARPAPWTGPREVAVRRDSSLIQYVQTESDEPTMVASGQLDINLSGHAGRVHIPIRFTEKPWIEDFATFASTRPERAFIIARSRGTCTSEGEANQQALDDARARLTEAIGASAERKLGPSMPPITATDVLQGGFILDRFAQSFEGSAGKIWRQALLLDVSGPKLAQLAHQKAGEFREAKMTWAWMVFSAVGVIVLIGVIYFFLNMATRGYYEWSLRIAGVVLAVVAVISILMIVH